jgi:hypothetical protein
MARKSSLPGRHAKTLRAIFARPDRANIAWNDFVALMEAAGAVVDSDGGSAHAFTLRSRTIVVHRPHEGKKEMSKASVKRARRFLASVGVKP